MTHCSLLLVLTSLILLISAQSPATNPSVAISCPANITSSVFNCSAEVSSTSPLLGAELFVIPSTLKCTGCNALASSSTTVSVRASIDFDGNTFEDGMTISFGFKVYGLNNWNFTAPSVVLPPPTPVYFNTDYNNLTLACPQNISYFDSLFDCWVYITSPSGLRMLAIDSYLYYGLHLLTIPLVNNTYTRMNLEFLQSSYSNVSRPVYPVTAYYVDWVNKTHYVKTANVLVISNCTVNNCDLNATCSNTPTGFNCTCNPGYSGNGQYCYRNCEFNNCDPNAYCSSSLNSNFECTCKFGYVGNGTYCEAICPPSTPILCAAGQCAPSQESCQFGCSNSLYQCFNGSCVRDPADCDIPPVFKQPQETSKGIPDSADIQGAFNVSIQSTSNTSIALLSFPHATLADLGGSVVTVSSVSVSAISNVSGSSVWGNNSFIAGILSSVLDIVLNSSATFSAPVQIAFANELPPSADISSLCLGFVNASTNAWQCESAIAVQGQWLVGNTTHFTPFAILSSSPLDWGSKVLPRSMKSLFYVYLIGAVLVLYTIALVLKCMSAEVDNNAKQIKLKVFQYAQLPYEDMEVVSPDGEQFSEASQTEQSPTSDVEVVKRTEIPYTEHLLRSHLWTGWVSNSVSRRRSRYERLTVLLISILGHICLAVLFTDASGLGIDKIVIYGVIVSLVVLIICFGQLLLFAFAPRRRRKKSIAYSIAILLCILFSLLAVFEGSDFNDKQMKTSLYIFSAAVLSDAVLQTWKTLATFWLMRHHSKIWRNL